jgi:hypothetical protein
LGYQKKKCGLTGDLSSPQEALLVLLEARTLFSKVVRLKWETLQKAIEAKREHEWGLKKITGKLSVTEIQDVLKSQPDSDEGDWISEIQELKRQLVIEIRRNHVLDKDLQKLDKRIGLLIKNRNNLEVRRTSTKQHSHWPDFFSPSR